MTVPAHLAHIVHTTRRYAAMIDWYCTVFNAHPVHRDPALTFLAFDEENHRFAIANLDVMRPGGDGRQGDVGVNHTAFTYAGAGDLLETYARLKALGITPYWPVHHGMTLSLYYQDPDGNRIELQADALGPQDAIAYFASPAFAANPIGVGYDPDALLADYRAGASEAALLRLPAGPPSPIPSEHGL
ncbi:VOC family protein [Blastomonas fulva]|jgi:catechol-2,3-dioxygenase|uniref:VOC family protein n=1 Tax=Blastomonas fulva TaxID=1550728 RepID=UPI003D2B12D6